MPSTSKRGGEREVVFYTTLQAAEALGITKRTLKNWLRLGKITEPDRNPITGYRRWTLRDIENARQLMLRGGKDRA